MKQELIQQELITQRIKDWDNNYMVVYTTNKTLNRKLRKFESGDEGSRQKAHPEMFAFKIYGSRMRVLKINEITLSFVSRILKEYPRQVYVFVGKNYWFGELPQEIQGLAKYHTLRDVEHTPLVGGA